MAGATRGLRLTDAEDALVERELKASGAKSFNALARELIREALAGRRLAKPTPALPVPSTF